MGSRSCDGNNFLDLVHFFTARKRERRAEATGPELPDLRAQLPPQAFRKRRASVASAGLAVDEDSR